jgi:hypothetical protein
MRIERRIHSIRFFSINYSVSVFAFKKFHVLGRRLHRLSYYVLGTQYIFRYRQVYIQRTIIDIGMSLNENTQISQRHEK